MHERENGGGESCAQRPRLDRGDVGILDADESVHDGLRREVAEETGLIVEPDRLTGVYTGTCAWA